MPMHSWQPEMVSLTKLARFIGNFQTRMSFDLTTKYGPSFFDRVGHETMYASKALTKYERPKMKRVARQKIFIFGRAYFVKALVNPASFENVRAKLVYMPVFAWNFSN